MEIEEIYHDLVLLRKHEQEKISEGGIIIPDTVNSLPKVKATVVKTGPGFTDPHTGKFTPIKLQAGQTVILSSYLCYDDNEFIIDGVKHYLVRERDTDSGFVEDEGFIGILPSIKKWEKENNKPYNPYKP